MVFPLAHRPIEQSPGIMKTFCPSPLSVLLLSATLGLLAPPLARAQNDQTMKMLEEDLPGLLEQANIPGLSIAVIRNGELFWSGAFGVKSLETNEPVDTQTIFEAASLSKPVFAYAVLRLAERGEFDLDTPLADHLPYERLEHEARYRQITARIVMSHSTGLPNWGGDRLTLSFDPGTAFNYSGEGFVYLQKTIEHLTGLTLDEVARREVFEPLGMTRSSYLWQDAFEDNIVARHSSRGTVSPIRRPSEGNAASSLMTTAEDYARFLGAIVQSEGLEAETIDAMLRPQMSVVSSRRGRDLEAKQKVSWGLGWGLHPMDTGHAFWHWGDNGDIKSFTMTDYGTGNGFVYFANSADGLALGEVFAERVFGEPAWGLRWLGYEQHDDTRRVARKMMARVFAEDGIEAGTAAYDDLRAPTGSGRRDAGQRARPRTPLRALVSLWPWQRRRLEMARGTLYAVASTASVSSMKGSSNQKRVPRPRVLSTWIGLPWACKICLTMDRPRPVPPLLRERPASTR